MNACVGFILRVGIYSLSLLLLSTQWICAAEMQPASRLSFKHILPDQLSVLGNISAIAQDAQGFIWIGGASGLARYDGYAVRYFRHDDRVPTSISHNTINHIEVARDGILWIATRNGLNRFDPQTETFQHFLLSNRTDNNDILTIHCDRKNRLWAGTRAGLLGVDLTTAAAIPYSDTPDNNALRDKDALVSIADDQEGFVWLAYRTGGIKRFNPTSGQFDHFSLNESTQPSNSPAEIRKIIVDSENIPWVGTEAGGLFQFNREKNTFEKSAYETTEKPSAISSIMEDRKGNLWVSDRNHLHVRPSRATQFFDYPNNEIDSDGVGNYVINTLFEDRAGDLWLGFFPSGLDLLDRQASVFHHAGYSSTQPNTITDGGVLSGLQDEEGNLWVGTAKGLNYLNVKRHSVTRFNRDASNKKSLAGDTILSIAEDAQHRIWLGARDAGLSVFNASTREFNTVLPSEHGATTLRGRDIWSMLADKKNNLWLATDEGINRFDLTSQAFEYILPPSDLMDGDTTLYSRVIYEDKKNNLWVGSLHGLYLYDRDNKTFTRFHHQENNAASLQTDFVLAIYEDVQGHLWVGTNGGGLNLFDRETKTFIPFTTKDGLADNVVAAITEDDRGNLWLATQKGISQFDVDKRLFRNYDQRYGLANYVYNRNAALRLNNGSLFFGHNKGFTLFNPKELVLNEYAPTVVLTHLRLGNKLVGLSSPGSPLSKAIGYSSSITLQPKDVVFSLEFVALSYHHADDNQYAYRLQGVDENWNYVGKNRSATYANIKPGTYLFEVKGANNDGVWSRYPTTLQITVLPPFWRTWWAFIIYGSIVCVLIYWLVQMNRLKLSFQTKKLEQERLVVKRLTQIDQLKNEFLANTSHELRTPLNGIIGLAESLRDGIAGDVSPKMKYHLSLIVDSGRRLATLVNDILDFSQLKNQGLKLNKKSVDLHVLVDVVIALSRPLADKKPITFLNNIAKNLPAVYADEDRVLQILHNLLGNAVKFTDDGVVSVSATVVDDFVQVEVSDTGVGIPADRLGDIFESFTQLEGDVSRTQGGTGLGLSVTKQLVELHGGTIRVESIAGIGSTFYFSLPMSYGLPEPHIEVAVPKPTFSVSEKDYAVDWDNFSYTDPTENAKQSILVVDDDAINRKVIANFLTMRGYHILEADCAEDAIALIESGRSVDLVLLDIMMPRVSGYEACKMLRETHPAYELPIILLTARSQMNDFGMAFESGANDFLVKPIAKETLLARVATHLQLHDVTKNLDKKVAERTEELNQSNAVLKQAQEDLEVAYKKLEEASLADPLTGLSNRRFLTKSIPADISIVERSYHDWAKQKRKSNHTTPREQDLVFMLLDIDHFKTVNDTYGHSAGDKVLEQLSGLLKNTLRESDYLVRWGGEEFLIVIRYCTREEVPELAERIRQAVADFVFDIGNSQTIRKTCSIGMAAYPFYRGAPSAIVWEQVIDTADRALYLAKNNGRNRWVNVESIAVQKKELANPATIENLMVLVEAGIIQLKSSHDMES